MKVSKLLTKNGLELICIVLPLEKPIFESTKEVIVYCQNRLVKGEYTPGIGVIEKCVIIEFLICPEFEEVLYEIQSNF